MEIKNIELRDRSNNESFYEIVCNDLIIGYLKKDSDEQWTLYSYLPNFKGMITYSTVDEGVSLIKEKLNEFVNKITKENQ